MIFSDKFVSATMQKNTIESPVNAPLFRKSFCLDKLPNKFEVTITGLGIYELFINGKRATKGYLSPYRANPNHFIYYDNYDLTDKLNEGRIDLTFTTSRPIILLGKVKPVGVNHKRRNQW